MKVTADAQAFHQQSYEIRLNEAALVMTLLVPGIGEIDMHAGQRTGRDHVFQHFDSVMLNDANIRKTACLDFFQQATYTWGMDFNAEEVCLRTERGDFGRGVAHAKADLQNRRRRAAEQAIEIQARLRIFATKLRHQLFVRTLLRWRHPALTQHEAADRTVKGVGRVGRLGRDFRRVAFISHARIIRARLVPGLTMRAMNKLILKAGREKSLKRRHPWVFSGAVDRVQGSSGIGETVAVYSRDGEFLAWAGYSPDSQIVARAWSFREADIIDAAFFKRRIGQSVSARPPFAGTNALRLVHGESDGLPGLVVDRYNDKLVVQITTAGAEFWRDVIADALIEVTGVKDILERSDVDVRELEGLPSRVERLRGTVNDTPVVIEENGIKLSVDLWQGHKTGFYLDQRDNRQLTRELSAGRDVLNCFCYTGGMSVSALAGGAKSVLSIDSSGPALAIAAENVKLNGLPADRAEWMEADVFQALRQLRDRGRQFDLIVLDPPKFAPTAHHAEKATRAYKDINLLGFKLLRPGGLLMTYSCSGGVSADLFQKVVAGAALDAGVDAQILRRLGPGVDHPVSVHFPEGDYLKGLSLRRGD